tara:strand:- start:151 stop:345 length:195 start_codon:yes stop_codon:yes gene_type:complete
MSEKELKKIVKDWLKKEWPEFKADHSEGHDEEWDDEGGLNNFQEVMSGFLSDMVEEVVEEIMPF